MQEKNIDFLDAVVNETVEEIESKAKSYYLEVEVTKGIKELARRVNKTESKFVNDLLKAVVNRYLNNDNK